MQLLSAFLSFHTKNADYVMYEAILAQIHELNLLLLRNEFAQKSDIR